MDERRATATPSTYNVWIAFIFIFNIIVGTGALTLPAVFAKAGWMLSLLVIILLALISYMTVTFVVEAMACTNAIKNWQHLQVIHRSISNVFYTGRRKHMGMTSMFESLQANESDTDDDSAALLRNDEAASRRGEPEAGSSVSAFYNLSEKFEMGEMAVLYFNDIGRIMFYLCFVIYLYGDLSIYAAAISKSLRDIVCDKSNGTDGNGWQALALPDNSTTANYPCWANHTLTRFGVYRLFLIAFIAIIGPFVAFSVQKTKYLQIMTAIFRWLAFAFMIGIAIKLLLTNGAQGHPAAFNVYGLPTIFGACVYSFMCHHSLPSLLTPIRDKSQLRSLLAYDYLVICIFYIVLAITGIFAFAHLEDLYTLNFIPTEKTDDSFSADLLLGIDYFLAAFPIFTLSASFPIIGITLRNNLQSLFLDMNRFETYNMFVRHILFPICTILPPLSVTIFTENLTSLVAFTGNYAGVGIQYIIPVTIVYFSRQTCGTLLGNGVINEYQSPFKSNIWLLLVLIWAVLCMSLVTVNVFFNKS